MNRLRNRVDHDCPISLSKRIDEGHAVIGGRRVAAQVQIAAVRPPGRYFRQDRVDGGLLQQIVVDIQIRQSGAACQLDGGQAAAVRLDEAVAALGGTG